MKHLFLKIAVCFSVFLAFRGLSYAQDLRQPYTVISKAEIPDSVFDQSIIDLNIQDFENLGFEIRHVYYLKFHFFETDTIFKDGQRRLDISIPREPDSTQVLRVWASTFILSSDGDAQMLLHSEEYSGSSILVFRSLNSNTGKIYTDCSFRIIPQDYRAFGFPKNGDYGFFLQFVSSDHPPLSTSVPQLTYTNVYPNPASDNLYLEWDDDDIRVNSLEIANDLGQIINQIYLDKPRNVISIPVSEFQSGLYWLIMKDHEMRLVGKESFIIY